MLESRVEGWLKDHVEKRGGVYLKFVSPGNIGVPDRIILYKGRTVFVELKQEHGQLSPIQQAQIERMRATGAEIHVVYGKRGAEALAEYLFGTKITREPPKTADSFGIEEWR